MAIETVEQFIQCALEYNKEHNITLDIKKPTECPVHVFASTINKACKQVNSGISNCPICSMPYCNRCGSHSVQQISRVTGYISSVSGWNEAKIQELEDRKRYNLK